MLNIFVLFIQDSFSISHIKNLDREGFRPINQRIQSEGNVRKQKVDFYLYCFCFDFSFTVRLRIVIVKIYYWHLLLMIN